MKRATSVINVRPGYRAMRSPSPTQPQDWMPAPRQPGVRHAPTRAPPSSSMRNESQDRERTGSHARLQRCRQVEAIRRSDRPDRIGTVRLGRCRTRFGSSRARADAAFLRLQARSDGHGRSSSGRSSQPSRIHRPGRRLSAQPVRSATMTSTAIRAAIRQTDTLMAMRFVRRRIVGHCTPLQVSYHASSSDRLAPQKLARLLR